MMSTYMYVHTHVSFICRDCLSVQVLLVGDFALENPFSWIVVSTLSVKQYLATASPLTFDPYPLSRET